MEKRILPRWVISERGATMVEHAIVMPVFFALLLGSFEVLRILYTHLSLQFAVTEASRRAIVQTIDAPASDIETNVAERLASLGVPLLPTDFIIVCPLAVFTAECAERHQTFINRGGPSEPLVFEVHRSVKPFGFANLMLTARVLTRNEPAI